MEWEIQKTRTAPTVLVVKDKQKYYIHSKYDPIKEASIWVEGLELDSSEKELVIIGVGMGYHLHSLFEKYPSLHIHVFEFNYAYMKWLFENEILSQIIQNKNITFYYEMESSFLLKQLAEVIDRIQGNLLIYKPSLILIEQEEIKHILDSYLVKKRTINEQAGSLAENYHSNLQLNDHNIKSLIGMYSDQPAVLVSAGPSLTKQLPLLKEASLKGMLVGCVGTALKPLIKYGIMPDFIMISDPKDLVMEQFSELTNLQVPLFYLSTANHNAIKNYQGPRYIVFQRGYAESENQAIKNKIPLIETGGSVATCLLDLIVKLGITKVALVGQDLAFSNNETHAANTHAYNKVKHTTNLIHVMDYFNSEHIWTSRNLFIYLKWFSNYVNKHEKVEFFNCTEGGAFIKGWNHIPFSEFIAVNSASIRSVNNG
ncbi:DUF115 domain-containing protein [Mesobacillus subterraneus]|uniref:motility associated factor glycosyltransferase family protein n=1 Tax=Mesobacillus subterraneus TaxID=285983 RepID=UPI00204262A3|nr:6-hydroxymethylpterin diphosphokinase MptE-like protein [Mesobacillus subterraneus]MCM3663586.1 DUF115 domain-containing protein [Mesobacillus subterraneus]MCM3683352.1 DUF115 domain-containing protein [Mesobacillus subterraneus]